MSLQRREYKVCDLPTARECLWIGDYGKWRRFVETGEVLWCCGQVEEECIVTACY